MFQTRMSLYHAKGAVMIRNHQSLITHDLSGAKVMKRRTFITQPDNSIFQ